MADMMRLFTFLIVLQLFYSFGITLLTHSIAPFGLQTMSISTQPFTNITANPSTMASTVESATKSQFNIPLIDLGALVFYTGNIVVDMVVNFFTMLPGIFNLLIDGLCMLFNVPVFYATTLKVTVFAFIAILYFLMIIQFILSIRSRTGVI